MTVITVPGMLPNPIIPREYYKNILLNEDVVKKLKINGIKEEEKILGTVSNISINNSMSVLSIGNKAFDTYLKLNRKISEISARFDINKDEFNDYTENNTIWNKLNQFFDLSSKIDISGLSNNFIMFRNQKINTLMIDIKKLMLIIHEIIDKSDELREMVLKAQNDIISLENDIEDASYEIEIARKSMILVSIASKKYIEDNDFNDIFISSVKRNIESVESRIRNINSTLISKITVFMSISDLKRNISVHAYTIDKAISIFIPAWMKISEDINKTIKNKNSLIDFEKNNKKNSISSRVSQLITDMKKKDIKEDNVGDNNQEKDVSH